MTDAPLWIFFSMPPAPGGKVVPVEAADINTAIQAAASVGAAMTSCQETIDGRTWDGYRGDDGQFYVLRQCGNEAAMDAIIEELGMADLFTLVDSGGRVQ